MKKYNEETVLLSSLDDIYTCLDELTDGKH